jgi:hypothetical protein
MVDVVSKSGPPKATCVKNIKAQLSEPYDPSHDLYKILREGIVEAHATGSGKNGIRSVAAAASDYRRVAQYAALAEAYISWWGRKSITWTLPPRSVWTPLQSTFGVIVNPELGLSINGVLHFVKLYFKTEPLSKPRVDIITQLMHDEFSPNFPTAKFSVLDIRSKKLHTVTPPTGLRPALIAELAYVAALWPYV